MQRVDPWTIRNWCCQLLIAFGELHFGEERTNFYFLNQVNLQIMVENYFSSGSEGCLFSSFIVRWSAMSNYMNLIGLKFYKQWHRD